MKARSTIGTGALMLGAALLAPSAARVLATPVAPQVVNLPAASLATALESRQPVPVENDASAPHARYGEAGKASPGKPRIADGPWRASCNYWGPAPGEPGTGSQSGDAPCGPGEWGIPKLEGDEKRPIVAMIATLPDPVHSSAAFEFDRMIDVITQAAGDNGYVTSYFWLPWRRNADTRGATLKIETAAGTDTSAEEREREPGLMILRPASAACDLLAGTTNPLCTRKVVYLFLVAQTTSLGVNRDQLSRALRYESFLWDREDAYLSIHKPLSEAAVIGPNNSGSASSLRDGLAAAPFLCVRHATPCIRGLAIAGHTSTVTATRALNQPGDKGNPAIRYISFSEDAEKELNSLESMFTGTGRFALLTESGTTFGTSLGDRAKAEAGRAPPSARTKFSPQSQAASADSTPAYGPQRGPREIVLPFPRELSILRNAEKEDRDPSDAAGAAAADADPYLHLSLKTGDVEDTVPHFSRELAPYVEESEWMALVRELKNQHTEVVAVSASSVLDQLFLAKYLHRDLPDARAVFFVSSDLLFARAGDATPYIGSVVATPYPLIDLSAVRPGQFDTFGSFWTASFYNAVSYTLWNPAMPPEAEGQRARRDPLLLAGYTHPTEDPTHVRPPPLWLTTIGRDGYYPLGIVDTCSSNQASILPSVSLVDGTTRPCTTDQNYAQGGIASVLGMPKAYPSFFWYALGVLVELLCLIHLIMISSASFWSPATRDLAVAFCDAPRRRAVYLHIGAVTLFAMAAVTSIPVFCIATTLGAGRLAIATALLLLLTGAAALLATLRQTLRSTCPLRCEDNPGADRCGYRVSKRQWRYLLSEARLYLFFNSLALAVAITVPSLWYTLCTDRWLHDSRHLFIGSFFSYRCLHPESGVSPLLPILLILFSWCLWAFFQTRRLRFSGNSRPILPGRLTQGGAAWQLYVDDTQLGDCSNAMSFCLYENVTCLLITHRLLWRFGRRRQVLFNMLFLAIYLLLFSAFIFLAPVRGLDRYVRNHPLGLTPFEFLISVLFYPLLVIAMTGALRMVLTWTSLRAGLLEALERSPLRYAFSRLTNVSWITMLRQSGIIEYWRDMTRSNESMNQLLRSSAVAGLTVEADPQEWAEAVDAQVRLNDHITLLQKAIADPASMPWDQPGDFLFGEDLPVPGKRVFLNLMCAIECDYAKFSEALLTCVLIPYWTQNRDELVEAEAPPGEPRSHSVEAAPAPVKLAEEFLALRYFSLMRAVLINLRQMMTFVSISFVVALIAWNSYPFQPRQWVDWAFTALLLSLGATIVWVFAQMHRDPILSRLTGTEANKLGVDFFIRLAVFGVAPVLTWMASQFPAIGGGLSRLIQSGTALAK